MVRGIHQARITGVGCHFPPSEDIPNPGIKPESPVSPILQADSLPAEASASTNRHYGCIIKIPRCTLQERI